MTMVAVLLMASAMAQTQGVVVAPVLDMMSKPTADADVVSQTRYGVVVKWEQEEGDWVQIRTPGDEYKGWVRAAGVRKAAQGETYATGGKVAMVESLRAHVYREASVTKHAPVVTLPYETWLEVVSEPPGDNGRWMEVKLADGKMGWIQRGDVSVEAKTLGIEELAALSKRFLGLPYTWGGTSSFGYDCSGFTQMLVRRGGVLMPRDAQPQADWAQMQKVERGELKAGDLLYFGSSAKRITHTGFYLGSGEFIHSTTNTHPVLQVSKLDDQPWTKLFVAARRWKR
ncbi:MAG: C40 family peptidase [Acidobacteria bacterium]|nr:C40 family peptidase [Acidobacteriota bacterium]